MGKKYRYLIRQAKRKYRKNLELDRLRTTGEKITRPQQKTSRRSATWSRIPSNVYPS